MELFLLGIFLFLAGAIGLYLSRAKAGYQILCGAVGLLGLIAIIIGVLQTTGGFSSLSRPRSTSAFTGLPTDATLNVKGHLQDALSVIEEEERKAQAATGEDAIRAGLAATNQKLDRLIIETGALKTSVEERTTDAVSLRDLVTKGFADQKTFNERVSTGLAALEARLRVVEDP